MSGEFLLVWLNKSKKANKDETPTIIRHLQ